MDYNLTRKVLIGTPESLSTEMDLMADHVVTLFGEAGYSVWDIISELPDGTSYIASPSQDPRFSEYILSSNVIETTLDDLSYTLIE